MNERASIAQTELEQAASITGELEQNQARALGQLCYDLLARQAEGRSLFVGEKFVQGRAVAHGVQRERAETPLGNVLAILERGPETPLQWALVAALFVRGFGQAVREHPEQRAALCTKLAGHADWLELSTPYRVLPLLDALLDPELAGEVHAALGALLLRDDAERDPQTRARNAGRIAALAEARTTAARTALERVEAQARDAYSKTLAALALGKTPGGDGRPCRVRGRLRRFPPGRLLSVLSWVSGYALLAWTLRLLLLGVGYLRDVEVELGSDALRIRSNTFVLGRQVRSVEQLHPLVRLRSARRAARFPSLYFLVGAFCFAVGVSFGGMFAFDAARTGDRALWLIAAALLLAGSGLDLLLEVLLPGGRRRVLLDLDLGKPYRTRVSGVALEDADRFLQELARRLPRSEGGRRAVV
jgi:hypothetical protein